MMNNIRDFLIDGAVSVNVFWLVNRYFRYLFEKKIVLQESKI